MSDDTPTRRDVLQRGVGVGLAALTASSAAVSPVEATDEKGANAIPAPFDAMPTIDDPDEEDRTHAKNRLPPRAVPDEGPIPDYHYTHVVHREIVVPEWALAATRRHLSHCDPDDIDRWLVEDFLMEHAHIWEDFVTPDGRDAAAVLLDELEAGGDG